jgi:hypothetical protein
LPKSQFNEVSPSELNEINELRLKLKLEIMKNELQQSRSELEKSHIEKEVEKYRAEKEIYKTENEYHKKLTTNAGNVIGKTMGALKYIVTNYNQAPQIKQLDEKSARLLLSYKTEDGKIVGPIVGKTPLQYMLDLYENNKLTQHLCNIIVSQYKKMNPRDQSIWNTDPNRLSFVIKSTSKTDKTAWENDKKGIKVNEYIIKPLLSQIVQLISEYDKMSFEIIDEMTKSQREKYADNSKFTTDLRHSINTGSLNKELLRFVTPYFYLSRRD